jgi:hypothetical protein
LIAKRERRGRLKAVRWEDLGGLSKIAGGGRLSVL